MVSRGFQVVMARRAGLRLLTVLAVIAVAMMPAQSAWAAASPTGEALTGAGVTTSGSTFGGCLYRASESGGASFTVPAASPGATGPYPGSFWETGHFSLSGYRNPPWKVSFNATFTITSGATTITGTLATPTYAWFSVGFLCGSTGAVVGYNLNGPVNYTATINGQTYHGTARVIGIFYTTAGAHDSLSETITMTYGQIAGTVTDHATGAAITGVCVHAYNSGGGVLASAATSTSGAYTLANVPDGTDLVGFSAGCGAANYLPQYYSDQPSLASANPVSVTGGATTTGINAGMVAGGQITGAVTDRTDNAPLTGICVQAFSSGRVVASAQTSSVGAYTLSGLASGSYQVEFSAGCGANYYVTQYYNDQASLASAAPVAVTAGTTTSAVNAGLVAEGHITGTVTDSTSHAPLAGICVDLFDGSGNVVAQVATDANGAYSMPPASAGSYQIGFFNCGGSTYAAQYYNTETSLAGADPVTIADGTTTAGINAAMVATTNPAMTPTAVGYYYDSAGNEQSLAETWNGTTWTPATASPAGARSSYLNAVSCPAANACTAVGYYYDSAGNEQSLAETWNGTTWTPDSPTGALTYLNGVSCPAVNACTAVGYYYHTTQPVAETWNGTTWTVATAGLSTALGFLNGVSCPAVNACMAVGYYYSTTQPLAETWNGTAWTLATASLPAALSYLNGVSCPAANACTAVGYYYNPRQALAESWNGTAWTPASASPAGAGSSYLNEVS